MPVLCSCGLPCVQRQSRATGPNHGRPHYACPEARCDFFKWVHPVWAPLAAMLAAPALPGPQVPADPTASSSTSPYSNFVPLSKLHGVGATPDPSAAPTALPPSPTLTPPVTSPTPASALVTPATRTPRSPPCLVSPEASPIAIPAQAPSPANANPPSTAARPPLSRSLPPSVSFAGARSPPLPNGTSVATPSPLGVPVSAAPPPPPPQPRPSAPLPPSPPGPAPDAPRCREHGLPMQRNQVHKEGPNKGRFFFTCSLSGASCTFEWDDARRQSHLGRSHRPGKLVVDLQGCSDPEKGDAFAVTLTAPCPAIKQALDGLLGGRYCKKEARWTFPIDKYSDCVRALEALDPPPDISHIPTSVFNVLRHYPAAPGSDIAVPWERLPASLFDQLMPFQRQGVEFAFRRDGKVLLGDEMGLGKTVQAIAIACLYAREWPLLICCPSSLRWQWAEQLERWLPFLSQDRIKVISQQKERPDHQVNIVSYDTAAKIADAIVQARIGVAICDEAHFLKTHTSQRFTKLGPVLKAVRRVVLLTGTPALARPIELYTQLSILVPRAVGTRHDFGMRYCNGKPGKWGGMDFQGHSNLLELNLFLTRTVMIRRMKRDVLAQLPPKRRQAIHLQVSKKEVKELEERLKKLRIVNLQDICFDDNAELSAAQRAAKKSAIEFYNDCAIVRIDAVTEYLQDFLATGVKCLIFGHHVQLLNAVEGVVKTVLQAKGKEDHQLYDYIRIDGSTKASARLDLVDHFRMNATCKVAVLSIQVAGTGLTFTPCSTVLFAELCWTPGVLVQCEDRVHRLGQESDSVDIRYLLAKNTCDEIIWPLINRKLDVVARALEPEADPERSSMHTEGETQYARRLPNQPRLEKWLARPAKPSGPMDVFVAKPPSPTGSPGEPGAGPPAPLRHPQDTGQSPLEESPGSGHCSAEADAIAEKYGSLPSAAATAAATFGEDASPPPAPKRSLPSGGDGMEKLQRLSCPKRPRLV